MTLIFSSKFDIHSLSHRSEPHLKCSGPKCIKFEPTAQLQLCNAQTSGHPHLYQFQAISSQSSVFNSNTMLICCIWRHSRFLSNAMLWKQPSLSNTMLWTEASCSNTMLWTVAWSSNTMLWNQAWS